MHLEHGERAGRKLQRFNSPLEVANNDQILSAQRDARKHLLCGDPHDGKIELEEDGVFHRAPKLGRNPGAIRV